MADNKQNQPADSNKQNTPPVVDAAAEAKRTRQDEFTKQWGLDGTTKNLTRDSVIGNEKARLVGLGKSNEEATKLAVQRGFEMIPE